MAGRPASPVVTEATAGPGTPEGLRRVLAARRPVDDDERRSLERVAAELGRLARPCDEGADPVHVTASAIVVGRRGTVLLLHRRLGRWLQPGGHIDPGEWPWEAARREALEETGLDVAHPPGGPVLVGVDVHDGGRGHTHLDLRYVVEGPDADPAPPPGESPEVRWCSWAEAEAVADAGLRRALAEARAWADGVDRG